MNTHEAIDQVLRDLKESRATQKDANRAALNAAFPVIVQFSNGLRHALKGTPHEGAEIDVHWDNLNLIFRFSGVGAAFVPTHHGISFVRSGMHVEILDLEHAEPLSSRMLKLLVTMIRDATRS